MKKYFKIIISSILAGFCITLGASTYLMCSSQGSYGLKIVGSFLFCFGFFTILSLKFWLYTGKVGNILNNKPKYFLDLAVCFIFNILGTVLLAAFIKLTRAGDALENAASSIVAAKQNDTWYSILFLSILCGIVIYIAVCGYEHSTNPLGKVLFAFIPIVVFILLSFEHVIANACYYTYAGVFNLKVIGYFALMALGNGIGAVFFDGLLKAIKYLDKE